MLLDAFLNIDGRPGESTDAEHVGEIEIFSFQHTIERAGPAGQNEEGKSSAAEHGFLSIVKPIDKTSPYLYLQCCSGKPFATVTLSLCQPTGKATDATSTWKKTPFLTIELQKAYVARVHPWGDGNDGPLEEIDFGYKIIKWDYLTPKSNPTGWDLTTNQASAG